MDKSNAIKYSIGPHDAERRPRIAVIFPVCQSNKFIFSLQLNVVELYDKRI